MSSEHNETETEELICVRERGSRRRRAWGQGGSVSEVTLCACVREEQKCHRLQWTIWVTGICSGTKKTVMPRKKVIVARDLKNVYHSKQENQIENLLKSFIL